MSIPRNPSSLSRRNFLVGLGATSATAALLAACGPGARPSGGTGGGGFAQPDGVVPAQYKGRERVVLWSTFAEHNGEVVDGLAQRFNDSQEDIFLEVQFQGSYADCEQKLVAGILAKQVPDISVIGVEGWIAFYLSNALAALDDYVDVEVYSPELVSGGQTDGATYWVPFARSTPLLYFNRDLFAQAGLPDRGPETWTELREWGAQFQGIKSPGGTDARLYGFSGQDRDWQFQGMGWNFGGSFSDELTPTLTNPGILDAAEYTRALIHDDKAAYMAAPGAIVTDFQNGLIGAAAMSTASLRGLLDVVDFELGAAFMPTEIERAVCGGGGGFGIPAGVPEERRQTAAKVLEFFAEPESAAEFTVGTGYIINTPEGAQEQSYKDAVAENPLFGLAREQLEFVRDLDPARRWVPSASVIIWDALQSIWVDNTDPAEAFETANAELQAEVDKFVLAHPDVTLD